MFVFHAKQEFDNLYLYLLDGSKLKRLMEALYLKYKIELILPIPPIQMNSFAFSTIHSFAL